MFATSTFHIGLGEEMSKMTGDIAASATNAFSTETNLWISVLSYVALTMSAVSMFSAVIAQKT